MATAEQSTESRRLSLRATHRRIGLVFVYAMLVMGLSGSVMAFNRSPTDGNVTGGLMTAYFVVTALTTVRPISSAVRWLTIGALILAGIVRFIRFGPLNGRARLVRHLWRMCFALFIAVGSFFSIRARVASILPDVFAASMFRMLPIPLVFVTMFYWLWRIRGKRPIPTRR